MTISLPPSKVKKILKSYFSGISQQAIADKLGTSQGSISHWVSRFDKKAINTGPLKAAEEFGVLDEIVELRALSVELEKAGMTTQDAGVGVKIMKKFKKLGVDPAQHEALVEVCAQVKDPGFVADTLKLHQIKVESGLEYEEAIVQYQKTVQELTFVKEKLDKAKSELEDITGQLQENKKKLDSFESTVAQLKKSVSKEFNNLKKKVTDKEKEAKVTLKEIEQVAALKADLANHGLDIPTLITLAKEFAHGKK